MGFAGARKLDERRRRRIAGETEAPRRTTRRRIDAAHVEEAPAAREVGSPILTWMPRARWPLAVLTAVSLIVLTAAVGLGVWAESQFLWAGTLGVRSGRLLATLSVGYCLASAVLCYLVFWFRKRSRRDFAGRYRRWLTAAIGFVGMALLVGTGVHHGIGGLISAKLPPAGWNTPTACWLVPVATAGALVGPTLLREMLAAGAGATLMLFGGLLASVVAAARLVGPLVMDPLVCDTACEIACVASLWCLFHAVWWHARHVVRVCNEPPRSGELRAKLRRAMPSRPKREVVEEEEVEAPKPKRRRGRKAAAEVEPEEPADEGDADSGPGVLQRVGAIAAAPVVKPALAFGRWKASVAASMAERKTKREEAKQARLEAKDAARAAKVEAAEMKRMEAEEKRRQAKEAKEAAVAERAAAKQAAANEAAAAKEAKRQAKQAAADAKAEAKRTKATPQPEPAETPQPKAKQRPEKPKQQDYDESDDWADEDEQGGRKQRRRKKRRRNAA